MLRQIFKNAESETSIWPTKSLESLIFREKSLAFLLIGEPTPSADWRIFRQRGPKSRQQSSRLSLVRRFVVCSFAITSFDATFQ